jgi:adenylate cyclase
MRQSTEQRRLLAVLVADIVSYSRLMAENEADTFYRVKDLQTSLILPATERNHGHVVKWTGDGFIGTFDSAVDAVRAAVEIQSGAAAAGAGTPDDRRIRFRIGINAGDVIVHTRPAAPFPPERRRTELAFSMRSATMSSCPAASGNR